MGFWLSTGKDSDNYWFADFESFNHAELYCPRYVSDTEPEAIFEACQYMLDNKAKA